MGHTAGRRLLPILALASAAALIVAFFARQARPTDSSSEPLLKAAPRAARAASALSDPESSSSLPSEPRTVQSVPPSDSDAGDAAKASVAGLRIVGSLRSIPVRSLAVELVVSVVDPPNSPVLDQIRVPLDSADRVDVVLPTNVLAELLEGRELRIWAENAGRRTKQHHARFGHGLLRRTQDENEEYRIDVDLEFLRLSTVSGSVIEATGSPMAGATVAVFSTSADNQAPGLLASQSTREDGSFLFELESCGRIAVAAYFPGFTAATRDAELPCERSIELPSLRLTRGVCIRGSVRTVAPGRSVEGMSVRARPMNTGGSKGQLVVGRESFQWTANGLQPYSLSAMTDDEGEFEICGLLPGVYSLHCAGTPCWLPGLTDTSLVVTAPVESVVMELTHPILRVSVTHEGGPVTRAFVSLRPSEFAEMKCPTHREGVAEIGVHPDVAYTAEVGGDGYESTEISIAPLASGEVRLERVQLQKLALGGTLNLEIDAETQAPLEYVCVVLERVVDGNPITESARFIDQRVVGKRATITNLPHDRYRVAVRAFGCHDVRTMLAPATFEVDIRSGETKTEPVWLPRGGRVQVRVRDPAGAVLPARCWIDVGSPGRWPLHFTPIVSGGVVELTQTLWTGDYTVHCELDGYRSAESSFTVRADELTRQTVTLTPAR